MLIAATDSCNAMMQAKSVTTGHDRRRSAGRLFMGVPPGDLASDCPHHADQVAYRIRARTSAALPAFARKDIRAGGRLGGSADLLAPALLQVRRACSNAG